MEEKTQEQNTHLERRNKTEVEEEQMKWINIKNNQVILLSITASSVPFGWKSLTNRFKTGIRQVYQHTDGEGTTPIISLLTFLSFLFKIFIY